MYSGCIGIQKIRKANMKEKILFLLIQWKKTSKIWHKKKRKQEI
jgi:hypothetical protein